MRGDMNFLDPSYDFSLFQIPHFSELHADELGASTYFSANTPSSYVDYSLNQLIGLTQPNNPNPYQANNVVVPYIPPELQSYFQNKDNITVYPSGTLPPQLQHQGPLAPKTAKKVCDQNSKWYERLFGLCCIQAVGADGECVLNSNDSSVGTVTPSGKRVNPYETIKSSLTRLPQGSGIFLIGVIVIILLIMFVRK